MRAVKSVSIDSERKVIITFLDGSTETLYPNCIWCDADALRQMIKDLLEEKADAITQTIENVTVATFNDGADEGMIKKLLVSIEPIQEGSGDPSPENVRPISGRTGLTVYRSGSDTANPTEFPVSWETEAGIVYGGSLDVVNGKLTVDRVRRTFDGSENWQKSNLFRGSFFILWTNFNPPGIPSRSIICSHAVYHKLGGGYSYGMCGSDTACSLFLMQNPDSTPDDFKEFIASEYEKGNPVQIVYNFDNPIEIEITPREITTLLGDNNIWADSGDILELEYVADTKLYIGESQSGRQTISNPDLKPVSEKTVEDLTEAVKAETAKKETQEETEDERGE